MKRFSTRRPSRSALYVAVATLTVATIGAIRPASAQRPQLAAWHSIPAMRIDQRACYERGQEAFRTAGFDRVNPQDGWAVGGWSSTFTALIHCVGVGDRTVVDVIVAAPRGTGDASSMRDRLKAYMRGRASTDEDRPRGWPLSEFRRFPGNAISGHNHETLRDVTTRQCAEACLSRDGTGDKWFCRSFDFSDSNQDGTGTCDLSRATRRSAGAGNWITGASDLTHYERTTTQELREPSGRGDPLGLGGPSPIEELYVPANDPNGATTSVSLASNTTYVFEVSGTFSAWDGRTTGIDAVWCFATWRCGNDGKVWGQLLMNGASISRIVGDTPAYSPDHVYRFEARGPDAPVRFHIADAERSPGDNSGGLTVRIYRR